MRILSLDPSVNNVGACLFDSTKKKLRNQWKWKTYKLEGHNYQMKMVDMVQLIVGDYGEDVDYLITEWPTFFSSEKGQVAAHQNYTINLAGACAYLAGRLGMDHRNWHIATATTWKGSVSKYITSQRFFRTFGIQPSLVSEHAIDATMLLLWWLRTHGAKAFQRVGEDFPESPLLQFSPCR